MIALNSSIAVPLDENCVIHEYEELRSEVDFLVLDRDLISEIKIEKDFGENFEYMEDLLFDIERIDISDVVEKDIDNSYVSTVLFTSGTTGKREQTISDSVP